SRAKFARLPNYARYENKRRKPAVKILSHDALRAAATPGQDVRARHRAGSARAAPAARRSPRLSRRFLRPNPGARRDVENFACAAAPPTAPPPCTAAAAA